LPKTATGRLDENPAYADMATWPERKVRQFLERCGLSVARPLQGKFVPHHDQVFGQLLEMMKAGELAAPLDVVHADAHADLGCGETALWFIMRELIRLPVEERVGAIQGLSEGNFLLFAIACRWLRSLVYVHHPDCFNDMPMLFYPTEVPCKGVLSIPCFPLNQLVSPILPPQRLLEQGVEPLWWEPGVQFERVPCGCYVNDQPFDFAFVALSPTFTLTATDRLIPILREYISEL
jgi:hypothetical protein